MNYFFKILLVTVIMIGPQVAVAGKKDSVVHLRNSPLVNGYTVLYAPMMAAYTPIDILEIFSNQKYVCAMKGGVITKVWSTGDSLRAVIIRSGDTFFIYERLGRAFGKENDTVIAKAPIGELVEEDGRYELLLNILFTSKQGRLEKFTSNEMVEYLNGSKHISAKKRPNK